jgi:hypothetical protein
LNFTAILFAQQFIRELDLIPVYDSEGRLSNTFSGGLNNIEHQFIDIDGDGDLDIIYFDSDKTFGWYENVGDKFNPEYKLGMEDLSGLFLSDWFYFVDIDNDNDFDYFTGNIDKISFYRNIGTTTSPSFILETDIVLDDQLQPIYSEFGSNPIFVDIDGDGDYDFITGNSAGTLTFYENIGSSQEFNFRFITNIWQDIVIIGTVTDDPRHGASSIDFVDIDNDNDLDLFWGDFFSKSLYVIENKGTFNNPNMELISDIYPYNEDSIKTSGFNMPRFADIDGDGDFDLFVSVLYDPTVPQSLMFYRNEGTPENPDHRLVTTNFLKTLDVGNNSVPVLVDIDNDGDLDLFIGSLNNPFGTLHFLENTGSEDSPIFVYSDSSYFNIQSDLSIAPAFGDIDNDGDYDLIIGRFNGTLTLYENTGTPSSPEFNAGITLVDKNGVVIDVGNSAVPFLVDIDNDQDPDLVIGAFNGRITLYRNIGTPENYLFEKDELFFTIISQTDTTIIDIGDNSSPFLIDYNNNGVFDLFTGSRDGKLYYFKNEGNNIDPIWNQLTDLFINERFGGNTSPYFVDIDNDGDYDLLLGNVKGGLYFYRNSEISNIVEREIYPENHRIDVRAFPNPFNPNTSLLVKLSEEDKISIDIFNILGEKIKNIYNGYLQAGEYIFKWNGRNEFDSLQSSGIYLVIVHSKRIIKTLKITFLK